MVLPIDVKIIGDKKIFIKFDDHITGEIDLTKVLKKENGDIGFITKVEIEEKSRDIIIDGKITLCKNAIHKMLVLKKQMRILGLDIEAEELDEKYTAEL